MAMNFDRVQDGHSGFILSNEGITGILSNGAFLSGFAGFATAQVMKVSRGNGLSLDAGVNGPDSLQRFINSRFQ